MKRLAISAALCASAFAQPKYDLLLQGGHVIDAKNRISAVRDVAIKDGKIAAVTANTVPSSAKQVVDVSGKLVLPGLIDTHGHVFQYVTGRFGLDADLVGVHSGVTTLIDQGGPFPYPDKDGSTFGNFEGLLPDHPRGYYAEYTVVTPGSSDRGARRIITGDGGEYYWTEDHYASFARIARRQT